MLYWTKNAEFRSPEVPFSSRMRLFLCSMTVLLPLSVMEKMHWGFSMWPVRILYKQRSFHVSSLCPVIRTTANHQRRHASTSSILQVQVRPVINFESLPRTCELIFVLDREAQIQFSGTAECSSLLVLWRSAGPSA